MRDRYRNREIVYETVIPKYFDRLLRSDALLGHITFVEIDHEIIAAFILLLPLIQEGQLSFTDKSMCTNTG